MNNVQLRYVVCYLSVPRALSFLILTPLLRIPESIQNVLIY